MLIGVTERPGTHCILSILFLFYLVLWSVISTCVLSALKLVLFKNDLIYTGICFRLILN